MAVYVGTSGWHYEHWTGVLYLAGTPARARMDFYTARFRSAELNASYYRWPSDTSFACWQEWEQQGRDVFVYLNNDGFGHAVNNALTLRRLLGRQL